MDRSLRLPVVPRAEVSQTETCVRCPSLCRHACPVAEAESRDTVAPQRLVTLTHLLETGRIPAESAGDLPYHCTHCGACQQACLHGQDVPRLLTEGRAQVLAHSAAPSIVREVTGHFAVAANPLGRSLDAPLQSMAEAADRVIVRRGTEVYQPGCTVLAHEPDVAVDFLRASVLMGAGSLAITRASGACCGLPLYWAGELEGFRAHARHITAALQDVETLVVQDPACAHALLHRYPEVGVQVRCRVATAAEWLAEAIVDHGIRHPVSGLAMHPTCHLSRGLTRRDVAEEITSKLAGGSQVRLPTAFDGVPDCCGASGLLPEVAPDVAATMARSVIDSARTAGANSLITFSPRCSRHLRQVDPSFHVCDPARLVVRM